MEHLDEKIITMMIELEEEQRRKNGEAPKEGRPEGGGNGEEEVDVSQPLVRIGGQLVPFVVRELLEGKLRVTLPKTWHRMSRQEAMVKYPSEHRPPLIYTNDTGSINLTFNHTTDPLAVEGIEGFTDTMVGILRSVQPIRSWIDQGMMERDGGRPAGYCEFIASSLDANLYHYMIFTEREERALLSSFTCTVTEMKMWKPIARAIMRSIQAAEDEKGAKKCESNLRKFAHLSL